MVADKSDLTELEARACAQFDGLLDRGELFWNPSPETEHSDSPFPVYFRISTSTSSKPYNPNDSSRRPGFLDDDPDFTLLAHVAPAHKLILNKFCWLRPQLILHTREFASQTDPLTHADLTASVDVLRRLGRRWMIIFNGGPNAGSSVAHKHLQALPKPDSWTMFPDAMRAGDGSARDDVPFRHAIHFFPDDSELESGHVTWTYDRLCQGLDIPTAWPAHNIILTHAWLLVVPRRSGNVDGLCMAGANGMVGQIWLKSEEQQRHWQKLGPMNVLVQFGVPMENTSG